MRWLAVLIFLLVALPEPAFPQTDEIQVYDGSIEKPGRFGLTLHNNFTPSGVKAPAFPGAVVADKSWNGVPEWAYGVNRWFELGLYLPLYSRDNRQGWGIDGFKVRALFVVPRAEERPFFYGVNFEFSRNARRWDTHRLTAEVRPLLGWHLRQADLIFNPIFDTAFDGIRNLAFAPATRLAHNFSSKWVVAVEDYADMGIVSGFKPAKEQFHQLYAVFNFRGKSWEVESGVGFGLTSASDKLTLKLSLSHDFKPKK